MSNNNTRLVYSTDPKDQFCPKCKELLKACICEKPQAVVQKNLTVIFRLEKNGRGGKTVTVLDGLPKNESFLKELTKELKAKCGTGGTYNVNDKSGFIEIQGDKRDQIKKILDLKQIRYKGM